MIPNLVSCCKSICSEEMFLLGHLFHQKMSFLNFGQSFPIVKLSDRHFSFDFSAVSVSIVTEGKEVSGQSWSQPSSNPNSDLN